MGLSSKQVSSSWIEANNLNHDDVKLNGPQLYRVDEQTVRQRSDPLNCPRCDSTNTKFCYYNNYSRSQPRHFCKSCRRHWTQGGTLRNIPIGGCRKNKRTKTKSSDQEGVLDAAPVHTGSPLSLLFSSHLSEFFYPTALPDASNSELHNQQSNTEESNVDCSSSSSGTAEFVVPLPPMPPFMSLQDGFSQENALLSAPYLFGKDTNHLQLDLTSIPPWVASEASFLDPGYWNWDDLGQSDPHCDDPQDPSFGL